MRSGQGRFVVWSFFYIVCCIGAAVITLGGTAPMIIRHFIEAAYTANFKKALCSMLFFPISVVAPIWAADHVLFQVEKLLRKKGVLPQSEEATP